MVTLFIIKVRKCVFFEFGLMINRQNILGCCLYIDYYGYDARNSDNDKCQVCRYDVVRFQLSFSLFTFHKFNSNYLCLISATTNWTIHPTLCFILPLASLSLSPIPTQSIVIHNNLFFFLYLLLFGVR